MAQQPPVNRASLNILPAELVANIVEKVDDVVTLGNVAMASYRLRAFAQPILQSALSDCRVYMPIQNPELLEEHPEILVLSDDVGISLFDYWMNLMHIVKQIAERPSLAGFIRSLSLNTCPLNTGAVSYGTEDDAILRLGRMILDSVALNDEDIEDWNNVDGWTALLILAPQHMKTLHIVGDFGGGLMPKTAAVAKLVVKHRLPRALSELECVQLHNVSVQELSDDTSDLMWFAALPSVQTFKVRNVCDKGLELVRFPVMRTNLNKLTFHITDIPPGILREVAEHVVGLRSLEMTYTSRWEGDTPFNDAHPKVALYMSVIQKYKSTLEFLVFEFPCGRHPAEREICERYGVTAMITSGQVGDAHLDTEMADHLYMGSLKRFTRLRGLITRSYMLYNAATTGMFVDLFPPSLEALQIVDDCRKSAGFEDALVELIYANSRFGPEYPRLRHICMKMRTVGPQLRAACQQFGIILVDATHPNNDMRLGHRRW